MRWSKSYLYTLKETPADAEIPSHRLLIRGGYIRKLAQGIYVYGPLALRAIRKFERIVREELDRRGCVEILMPMVQPKEIWEETHRWHEMGENLLKFKNRTGQEWCLGATHEEVVTDFVRKDIKSYRDLPITLYQIQAKYRDEIRPRFGLLRGREFIMKDAYSFDLDAAAAAQSYQLMHEAYTAIFSRLGVKFVVVNADSGNIGGSRSQEFHILADSGEDHLLVSESDGFAANAEVCPAGRPQEVPGHDRSGATAIPPMERFATPGLRTIAELAEKLQIADSQLVKTLFFDVNEAVGGNIRPVAVLLRGSDEMNPIKLKNLLGLANPPRFLSDDEVRSVTGALPGSCGPVGLKIPIYADWGLQSLSDLIVGANQDNYHLRHVQVGRDFEVTEFADLRVAVAGDPSPTDGAPLRSYRGIEVGHIFFLGSKYSAAMGAKYLGQNGEAVPIEMGCYGIGISRTVQAVIEQSHDSDGMIWPLSLAPYHVHICLLDPDDSRASSLGQDLYERLSHQGIDVLMDDRVERPGVKFKDADLLGMPIRLNIGRRGLERGEVELVIRRTRETHVVSADQVMDEITRWFSQLASEKR